jgi:hypothetical protein
MWGNRLDGDHDGRPAGEFVSRLSQATVQPASVPPIFAAVDALLQKGELSAAIEIDRLLER